MAQHHNYSIQDLESLIPYERDLYLDMLVQYLKEQKEMMEQLK